MTRLHRLLTVAVKTRISPRPPHGSRRALLTHRAPLWSAKIQRRSSSIGHEGVLVVKSVQYGVRHYSTCSVEAIVVRKNYRSDLKLAEL